MRSALTTFVAVFVTTITATATLGQLVPPTEGHQLGSPAFFGGPLFDVVMPLTIAQCAPVLIYYDATASIANDAISLLLSPPLQEEAFAIINFPPDVGYLEWICNIPTGETVNATAVPSNAVAIYVVQPGSSYENI